MLSGIDLLMNPKKRAGTGAGSDILSSSHSPASSRPSSPPPQIQSHQIQSHQTQSHQIQSPQTQSPQTQSPQTQSPHTHFQHQSPPQQSTASPMFAASAMPKDATVSFDDGKDDSHSDILYTDVQRSPAPPNHPSYASYPSYDYDRTADHDAYADRGNPRRQSGDVLSQSHQAGMHQSGMQQAGMRQPGSHHAGELHQTAMGTRLAANMRMSSRGSISSSSGRRSAGGSGLSSGSLSSSSLSSSSVTSSSSSSGGTDDDGEDDDDRGARKPRPMTQEEIVDAKREILYQMDRLEKKGVRLPRKFHMVDSLDEMRGVLERLKLDRELDVGIKFQRRLLMTFVSGLEYFNKTFDPFDVYLDGWSDSINEGIGEYDDVFEDLYVKYRGKAKMAPEMKLLFMVGGSGVMFHMTNSMFRNSSYNQQDVEYVMKKNPDLRRQFAQAAMNTLGEDGIRPSSPSQGGGGGGRGGGNTRGGGGGLGGGGGIYGLIGSLFGGGGGGGGGKGGGNNSAQAPQPPPHQPVPQYAPPQYSQPHAYNTHAHANVHAYTHASPNAYPHANVANGGGHIAAAQARSVPVSHMRGPTNVDDILRGLHQDAFRSMQSRQERNVEIISNADSDSNISELPDLANIIKGLDRDTESMTSAPAAAAQAPPRAQPPPPPPPQAAPMTAPAAATPAATGKRGGGGGRRAAPKKVVAIDI